MVATAAAACTVWLLWNSSPPPAPYLCASCRFALCSLCKANPSSSHFFFQPPLPLLPPPRWFAAISKGGKIRTCFLLCQHSPTWTDAKSALAAFFFLFTHPCPLHWRRQSRCSTTSDSDFFFLPLAGQGWLQAGSSVFCLPVLHCPEPPIFFTSASVDSWKLTETLHFLSDATLSGRPCKLSLRQTLSPSNPSPPFSRPPLTHFHPPSLNPASYRFSCTSEGFPLYALSYKRSEHDFPPTYTSLPHGLPNRSLKATART